MHRPAEEQRLTVRHRCPDVIQRHDTPLSERIAIFYDRIRLQSCTLFWRDEGSFGAGERATGKKEVEEQHACSVTDNLRRVQQRNTMSELKEIDWSYGR